MRILGENPPGKAATTRVKQPTRYRAVKRGAPAPVMTGGLVAAHDSAALPRRDYKKIIGGVFFAVLMVLIFFSKTIYAYNLPVVTATKPQNGRLSKLETSSGIVEWDQVENLYAGVDGRVEEVLVKEGDTVSKGQGIYRLSFDREEAERKLREIQNSRDKLQIDIRNINLKLERQTRYMADLADETYEQDDISAYELAIVNIDIRNARDELADVRERYKNGEATELELDRARYNLQALYLKEAELERKHEEQSDNAEKTIEEQEKLRQSKLKDYEEDIAALELDLQAKNIDLSSLSIQEEPYKKALEDFETHATVTAPADGAIISLGVHKGEAIRENQLIASMGVAGAFKVECSVSLENNFILPGDIAELSNSSNVVTGSVTKITPAVQGKTITIALESDEVAAGETFDITFKKTSDTTYTLVPSGALNQDNDGYFLNQVKRRNGILGREYYLERLSVEIGDSDSQNTVILRGVTFFEPVALLSDKTVASGDVISLSNEGDFFEK